MTLTDEAKKAKKTAKPKAFYTDIQKKIAPSLANLKDNAKYVFQFFPVKVKTEEEKEDGTKEEVERIKTYRLTYSRVFDVTLAGLKPKYFDEKNVEKTKVKDSKKAEKIIKKYIKREKLKWLEQQSERAYYSPISDTVVTPLKEQFGTTAGYYTTRFHEMAHSTGAKKRLNRKGVADCNVRNKKQYSLEELTAEISAAMLMNECGLETEKNMKNHAAYLKSWIQYLMDNPTAITSAATLATKAVEYIGV